MSRLAKRAIIIPKGCEVKISTGKLEVKGPKGTNALEMMKGISAKVENDSITLSYDEKVFQKTNYLGLYWALATNLIEGVSKGFEKSLQLIGVGFRAAVKGTKLDLQVGYSHPTELDIPEGLNIKIEQKGTEIIVTGIDKQKVGHFAACIRAVRPPEPYKGKGIRYKDEYVRKKAGKSAKAGK